MSLLEKLEPGARDIIRQDDFITDGKNAERVAAMSIAISLKRIADVMERGAQLDVAGQFHEITNLAWEAGRSFKQGAGG